MKKIILLIVLSIFTGRDSMANQGSESVISATIVKYGIYKTTVAEKTTNSELPYSSYEEMSAFTNIQITDSINARIGVEFGLSYILKAINPKSLIDRNKLFNIKTIVIYPNPGIRDIDNNKIYQNSVTHRNIPVGAEVYEGYFFGSNTDIVEGEWIFQLWHNKHKIAEKKFNIIKDE